MSSLTKSKRRYIESPAFDAFSASFASLNHCSLSAWHLFFIFFFVFNFYCFSIPLPTDVTNIALDDIPLPVPVSRSSNATAEVSNTSEIHSPKNKLDSTPAVEHGKESDYTET